MKLLTLLFFNLSIFVGCSSTYIIKDNDQYNYIGKINNLSKTYTSSVTLNNGIEFSTSYLQIENDTLYVQRYQREAIPLDSISTIKLRDLMRGVFDGVFMGIPVALGSIVATRSIYGLAFYGVPGFIISVVANTLLSGNKYFIFEKNQNNSFRQIN